MEDLSEFIAEQKASQEMATAMNSMLLAAMSTGNPYVIAAAMVIMAIMAIFGDVGSGDGDGKGGGNQQSKGEQGEAVGTGNTDDSASGSTDASSNQNDKESTQDLNAESADSGLGLAGSIKGYENVKPGVDATIMVKGDLLTFRSVQSLSLIHI